YVRAPGRAKARSDGLPRQLKAVRDYAAAHGITIVKAYSEEAGSVTANPSDRPAWNDLMTALHADGVRFVLIDRLDRVAHGIVGQEMIIADLRRHGFELISIAEPDLNATDNKRAMVRQLLGAVEQYEKSQFVLKLRGGRLRQKAETGRCEGRKPF